MQVRRGIPGCRSSAHASQGYELLAAGRPEGLVCFLAAQRAPRPAHPCPSAAYHASCAGGGEGLGRCLVAWHGRKGQTGKAAYATG